MDKEHGLLERVEKLEDGFVRLHIVIQEIINAHTLELANTFLAELKKRGASNIR